MPTRWRIKFKKNEYSSLRKKKNQQTPIVRYTRLLGIKKKVRR